MTDSRPTLDLEHAGDRVRLRPGDLDSVVARARRRTARTRRAMSVLTAVAVVASVPVAQRILTPDEEETPVATSSGLARADLGLTWRSVEPRTALGDLRGLATGKRLYGVSSAPGERHVQGRPTSRVVWRSEDGIDWSAMTTLGPDLYLAHLSAPDQRIYALGTAPGQAVLPGRQPTLRSVDLVVAWSDDEGQSWQKKVLPLDVPAESATRSGSLFGLQLASGPKGTLAVAVPSAQLDVPALLPEGATAPHGWATTETGVDVLGPQRDDVCPAGMESEKSAPPTAPIGETHPTYCHRGDDKESIVVVTPQEAQGVQASYTWEQLDVSGDVLRAARRDPIAFFAPPGSTDFERVELGATSLGGVAVHVQATDDGFDVLLSRFSRYGGSPEQYVLYQSADGRSWTNSAIPTAANSWVGSLGVLGGRTAFITSEGQDATLVLADGQGGWRTASLSGALAPDVVEGRRLSVGTVAFGEFGVAVHAVVTPARNEFQEREVDHRLLVSRDGVTWDDVPLSKLVDDERAQVNRLTITGEEIVVTASLPGPERNGPRRQVAYVGSAA